MERDASDSVEKYTDKDTNLPMYKCKMCKYKSFRVDHVKRHINTVHEKKKIVCECGASISPPVLNRHKTTSCPLKKSDAPKMNDGTVSGQCRFNYKVITSADGMCTITYDDIVINGIKMSLTPVAAAGNGVLQGKYYSFIQESV